MSRALILAVAVLLACGGKDDRQPVDSAASTTTPSPTDTAVVVPFVCVDEELSGSVPLTHSGSTDGAGDDIASLFCAGAGKLDTNLSFTAPEAGRYAFALDADFDAVLVLLSGDCAEELACSDVDGSTETLMLDLASGQQVVLVVDGAAEGGAKGDFDLLVDLVPATEIDCGNGDDDDLDGDRDCSDADCWADPACEEDCGNAGDDNRNGLIDCEDPVCAGDPECLPRCPDVVAAGTLPELIEGNTTGTLDELSPTCAFSAASDVQVAYTAPEDGDYIFDLLDSDFETVMAVYDGCGGAELACSTEFGPWSQSQVMLSLTAGQTVIVDVDGRADENGTFALNVTAREDTESVCDDGRDSDHDGLPDCYDPDCEDAPECEEVCDNAIDDNLDGNIDCDDPACADDRACDESCPEYELERPPHTVELTTEGRIDQHDPSCADPGSPDASFLFTAPSSGTYTFDTFGSVFDTVLMAYERCGGDELACNDDAGYGYQSRIRLDLEALDEVIIVVDGFGGDRGDFVLSVDD